MNFSNLFPTSTQVITSRWCAEMCCVKDTLESEQKNRKSDARKLMNLTISYLNVRISELTLHWPEQSTAVCWAVFVSDSAASSKKLYWLDTDGGVEHVEPLVGRQFPSQACVSPCIDICFLARRLLNKFEWQQTHKRRSFKAEKKKIVVLHNFGRFFLINFIFFFTSGKTCSIKKWMSLPSLPKKGLCQL